MINENILTILTLVEKEKKNKNFIEETFETNNEDNNLNEVEIGNIKELLLINNSSKNDIGQCYKTIYEKNENNYYEEKAKFLIDFNNFL